MSNLADKLRSRDKLLTMLVGGQGIEVPHVNLGRQVAISSGDMVVQACNVAPAQEVEVPNVKSGRQIFNIQSCTINFMSNST